MFDDEQRQGKPFGNGAGDRPQGGDGPDAGEAPHREPFKDEFDEPPWPEKAGAADPAGRGRPRLGRGVKILLIVLAVLMLPAVAMGAYVLAFYSQVQDTRQILIIEQQAEQRVTLEDAVAGEEAPDVGEVFPEHIVNIALVGFDRGWNRENQGEYLFRPDMLSVFSIDFEKDRVSVVRLTRDSYVPIHGMGGFHDKINHSFFYGYYYGGGEDPDADGMHYTLQTLSNALGGIPIHYYASVDMYSVIELVDAVGGIYYESEQTIIDQSWNVGEVLVPEGPQIMDGRTYLHYLQYRDDKTDQDYGRIDRQMNLLKQTFHYLREKGRISDLPTVYRVYKDFVETDLNYRQIAALAFYARDLELDDDSLRFYTVRGHGQTMDGTWYQVLNQDDRLGIIEEVFGIRAERWPHIVLQDSPEYLAEQAEKERLERFGSADWWQDWPLMGREEGEGNLKSDLFERDYDFSDGERGDAGGGLQPGPENVPEGTTVNGLEPVPADGGSEGIGTASGERVMVPTLRGMSYREAEAMLLTKGLVPGAVEQRPDRQVAQGSVIGTDPLPGIVVAPGTAVNLVVSEGSPAY